MQHFLATDQIEQRAAAIGVKPPKLCAEAKISESTWSRWKSGNQEPLASAAARVTDALIRLETEMLERLIALHPDLAADLVAKLKQGEAA